MIILLLTRFRQQDDDGLTTAGEYIVRTYLQWRLTHAGVHASEQVIRVYHIRVMLGLLRVINTSTGETYIYLRTAVE